MDRSPNGWQYCYPQLIAGDDAACLPCCLRLYWVPPKPCYTTFRKSSQTAESLSPNTGDVSVELDALPVDVLRVRIVAEVEKRMDVKQVSKWQPRVGALDD
jgi:hypothetical protein